MKFTIVIRSKSGRFHRAESAPNVESARYVLSWYERSEKWSIGALLRYAPFGTFRTKVIDTKLVAIARIRHRSRISRLFVTVPYLPKLDVAGSNPVSRSIFS